MTIGLPIGTRMRWLSGKMTLFGSVYASWINCTWNIGSNPYNGLTIHYKD